METIAEVKLGEAPVLMLSPEDRPDVDALALVTEDDTPVDNFLSEKQQRLLTEPLYSSWSGPGEGGPFLAAANVGLFASVYEPPVVPDVFLSLEVTAPQDWRAKRGRSYFFWEFGKAPEVVIEIVSNREGGETGSKMRTYARMGISYYAIYDPLEQAQEGVLRVYELHPGRDYVETTPQLLAGLGLGLTLWQGVFENKEAVWLRWQDGEGNLIPTGAERADQEHQHAEQERHRAEHERQRADQEHQHAAQERHRAAQERQRADQEHQHAERLIAQLRALGVEPEGSSG